ncbi:lemA family protein [Brachyspira sp. CAG:484]|nr:lemA family protein [Brachyspira sp. CAG:484]
MEKMFISGNMPLIIIAVVVLVIIYGIYYSLIQKKNKVKEAFSSIDVQLKKRYDLIPNVLFIANKFMEHERGLLEDITKLRAQAAKLPADLSNAEQKIQLDGAIAGKMGQLMVAVENYPQLKSDQTMLQAMQTYNEQEEHIAAARRFYNSAVLDLNNAVEIFPSSMIAAMLNIKQMPFFEATEQERQAVDASQYFK